MSPDRVGVSHGAFPTSVWGVASSSARLRVCASIVSSSGGAYGGSPQHRPLRLHLRAALRPVGEGLPLARLRIRAPGRYSFSPHQRRPSLHFASRFLPSVCSEPPILFDTLSAAPHQVRADGAASAGSPSDPGSQRRASETGPDTLRPRLIRSAGRDDGPLHRSRRAQRHLLYRRGCFLFPPPRAR